MNDGGNNLYSVTHVSVKDSQIPQSSKHEIRYDSASGTYGVRTSDGFQSSYQGAQDQNWKNICDQALLFNDVWEPYSVFQSTLQERIKEMNFGDGYKMSQPEGLNSAEIEFSLSFKNITDIECKQVLAFVELKGGVGTFNFYIGNPFNKTKVFRVNSCSHAFEGFNSNDLEISISEVYSEQNF